MPDAIWVAAKLTFNFWLNLKNEGIFQVENRRVINAKAQKP